MNALKLIFVLTISVIGLVGCSTLSAKDAAELSSPLICNNREQCETYWQRAQIYITHKSEMKIQLVNDTIIQTFTGPQNSVIPSYSLSKSHIGNGSYQIFLRVNCPNIYGMCYPSPRDVLALQLIRFMKTGTE